MVLSLDHNDINEYVCMYMRIMWYRHALAAALSQSGVSQQIITCQLLEILLHHLARADNSCHVCTPSFDRLISYHHIMWM